MKIIIGTGDGAQWDESIFTGIQPLTKQQRLSRWKSARRKYVIKLLDRSNQRND